VDNTQKNYNLDEMIEIAKNSECGGVWYSENGPIEITKEGELRPLLSMNLGNDPILNPEWKVNLKKSN
jgi:hypothetical protein